MSRQWTIFTNHAAVLLYLLEHPDATIRRIADDLDLAERTVTGVVHDLRDEGYLLVRKIGRHNVYQINLDGQMRRPEHEGQTLASFLEHLARELARAQRTVQPHA
jgi:DNA-binding MarR family transcriptional regulator